MAESDNPADVLRGQELIERLCDTYLRQLLAEDRASRQSGEESGDVDVGLLDVADWYRDDVAHERVEAVAPAAEALLAKAGVELSAEALQRFLRELLRTRVTSIGVAILDRRQDASFAPRTLSLQRPSAAVSATSDPAPDPHTVGELAQLYIQHQHDSGTWKPGKTRKHRAKRVQQFVDWFGADTPLTEIDPLRCQGVFDLFKQRNLAPTTQNTELKALSGLLNYGVRVEWMQRNPAKGLRAKEPPAREQRVPLTSADLRRVFSPALLEATKGRNPIGRRRGESTPEMFMGERLWGPLLCLYAGLRAGEVVQLRLDSFETVDDVLCVSTEPEDGQTLKTEGSRRHVPVHSHLVALGLVDYIEELRAAGERFLFPRVAKLKTPVKALTDWFPNYRKQVGVTDARQTLHSLRHTFNQHLANAGVQDSTISDLMGHRDHTITRGRYGSGTSAARLRDAVELLDFRESLSGLGVL